MISKKTKYAIHALLYLAKKYESGELSLISQISEKENIPKKFLETILLDLKNAGILGSKKGKGGGYYLLKKPSEVNLAEIIRLFDGAIALVSCATYKYYEPCKECPDEAVCGIRDVFIDVRNETVKQLKQSTLANILERERILKEELHSKS
ncbi:MAG: Rrf2 family transcriptional regulator [Cytophagales bacterium]|nr:Rrf2 family transcriptional regulator [Cytophagales bacterium]MDW8383844.1 Rrf2 family transcriptional regulator [Flammeovirgaceae bacterium]